MDKIPRKIERLLESYPPQRVNQTRQKLDAFWNGGEMSGLPFTLRRRDVPIGLNHNNYELSFFTFDNALNAQLDDRLLKASLPDDYVPSLITGNSPYYLSVAFGCRWQKVNTGMLVSHPLIQIADEIGTLEMPDFSLVPKSPFTQCMERIEYFLEKTKGMMPLAFPDPQGPMSLACQLWNQGELFVSMIADPEAVHRIMRLTTDTIIKYFRYLFSRFGREHFLTVHCHPYLYRKEGEGVPLSEDMFGVLSPAQLEEFLIPYLNQISAEFGTVILHSCGDCTRKFRLAGKIKGLAGVNFGQTDISKVSPDDISNLCLISNSDWVSRNQISDYIRVLKENSLRGWIQVQIIAGEIEQEASGVTAKQWLALAEYLKGRCESAG